MHAVQQMRAILYRTSVIICLFLFQIKFIGIQKMTLSLGTLLLTTALLLEISNAVIDERDDLPMAGWR